MEYQPIQQRDNYISALTGIEYQKALRITKYQSRFATDTHFIEKRTKRLQEFKRHLSSHGFTDQEIESIYG